MGWQSLIPSKTNDARTVVGLRPLNHTCLGTMHLMVGALPVDPNLKFQVQVQPEAYSPASLSQCPNSAGQSIAAGDRPQQLILQFPNCPLSQIYLLPLSRLNWFHCHHAPHWQAQTLAPLATLAQHDSMNKQCGALLKIRKNSKLITGTLKSALTLGGPPA